MLSKSASKLLFIVNKFGFIQMLKISSLDSRYLLGFCQNQSTLLINDLFYFHMYNYFFIGVISVLF